MQAERVTELETQIGERSAFAMALRTRELRAERARQSGPGGLHHFIRYFWDVLEPTEKFVDGWPLHAICQHLEAVHNGYIQKLLITVPPGSMKSLACSVFYPAWQWSAGDRPSERYINFAYASYLTERDNERMLALLKSKKFQELWGPRRERDAKTGRIVDRGFKLTNQGKEKIGTSCTGWKLATSVGGVGTGERGSCIILDDPHSIKDDTSEVVRPETVRWFKEAMSNRLNNMDTSCIIAIMQRSHEADVAGTIIDEDMGYVHLNIPLHFESDNRCVTRINGKVFWSDPRTVDRECFWKERFSDKAVADIMKLGEHVYVGQYQQRPEPRGGGLFKRSYWRVYDAKDGKFPDLDYVVCSLDGAFTDKKQNDPNGFSAWGCFRDEDGNQAVILLSAWRKHLTLNGTARRRRSNEPWPRYKAETEHQWGVTQWVRYESARLGGDLVLIENKANGHDVFNEMLRLSEHDPWALQLQDPKGLDKWARGIRVQPVFTEGLVWRVERAFAKTAVDEMASFPRGRYDDITDSATQALWWLRKHGFLTSASTLTERAENAAHRAGKKRQPKPLYPV